MNQEKEYNQEVALFSVEKEQVVGIESKAEQDLLLEISRGANESPAAYFARTSELIGQKIIEKKGRLFDVGRAREEDLPEDVREMIAGAMEESLRPQEAVFDSLKNEKVIKTVEAAVGFHDKTGLIDSASFDKTQRKRKFFEIQPGSGAAKRETYLNTLFVPYNTEATREFVKKTLDDKKIVLLGGGRSQLGLELRENNIAPREIVNVDPFVENPESGSDQVVSLSATAENFNEEMGARGIENVDEIWAEYSVPAYLEDPKEINQLFKNIDALLAEGGSARIWPLEVGGAGDDSAKLERKNALVKSLEELNATNKYDIALNEAPGRGGCLTLNKLKPSPAELQKREDQKAIQKIREEIEIL